MSIRQLNKKCHVSAEKYVTVGMLHFKSNLHGRQN